eukprot:TRINITY_DN18206_c0_g1_i1.p1 TRINITY_DN18206_c0_g1~~TRINITY_DN18206_c0_g1_i1.p1  ORF type:complete len:220 (-),score=56.68 TRINITY_DN18206_c0_g1_i1:56-685(-)
MTEVPTGAAGAQLQTPTMRVSSPLDKEIRGGSGKGSEVSLSAFAFLFSELVQYTQSKSASVQEFQQRLAEVGYAVGVRMLELNSFTGKGSAKRELTILDMLGFLSGPLWRRLFGKKADRVEQTVESGEYIICDDNILVSQYISTPNDKSGLNCASLVAGIVQGVLDSSEFNATVVAHNMQSDTGPKASRTGIFIRFDEDVLARNAKMTS